MPLPQLEFVDNQLPGSAFIVREQRRALPTPRPSTLEQLGHLGDGKSLLTIYASLLKQCSSSKSLPTGRQVHSRIVAAGYGTHTYLGNLLVQMYGNCGSVDEASAAFGNIREPDVFSWTMMLQACAQNGELERARTMFDRMPERNVVAWTALLTGYAQKGHLLEARGVFEKLPQRNVISWNSMIAAYGQSGDLQQARRLFDDLAEPTVASWNTVLRAYAQRGHVEGAQILFDKMTERNHISWKIMVTAYAQSRGSEVAGSLLTKTPQWDVAACNALLGAYALNGHVEEAKRLFDEMPERNLVSWSAVIGAYCKNDKVAEAMLIFERMAQHGVVSGTTIIQACSNLEDAKCMYDNMPEKDHIASTCMLTILAKNGHIRDAKSFFDKMPEQSAISWNAMFTAFAQNGQLENAKKTLDRMPQWSIASWNSMITAYGQHGSIEDARQMFDTMPECNVISWTSMITAYGQHYNVEEAKTLFDKMPERTSISWNAMMGVYAEHGENNNVLNLFKLMDLEGVKPVQNTYAIAFAACGKSAALQDGKLIHASFTDGRNRLSVLTGNALINMYGKCGCLKDAKTVFNKLSDRNVVSWSAIVVACVWNGHGKDALEHFWQMNLQGMEPDYISFISILSACSHKGLLSDGWSYFTSMSEDHGILPRVDHYACMVDLLGRIGQLDAADDLVKTMPFKPDAVAWRTLLGACRSHDDIDRGSHAARSVFKLDRQNAASYDLLANIHAQDVWL